MYSSSGRQEQAVVEKAAGRGPSSMLRSWWLWLSLRYLIQDWVVVEQ